MQRLKEVSEYFGSQSELAEKLGLTRQAITLWKIKGVIPPVSAIEIERITNGKFKAVDLTEGNK